MSKRNNYLKGMTILIFSLILYYQMDYKRHFISNRDNSESFTIWQRLGSKCYIVPGKYYSPFKPHTNYIETANYRNYIAVIFNTEDDYKYKIAIYNDYKIVNLDSKIKVYQYSDSLLVEYKMLKKIGIKRVVSENESKYAFKYNFLYIDLNDIYGITVR